MPVIVRAQASPGHQLTGALPLLHCTPLAYPCPPGAPSGSPLSCWMASSTCPCRCSLRLGPHRVPHPSSSDRCPSPDWRRCRLRPVPSPGWTAPCNIRVSHGGLLRHPREHWTLRSGELHPSPSSQTRLPWEIDHGYPLISCGGHVVHPWTDSSSGLPQRQGYPSCSRRGPGGCTLKPWVISRPWWYAAAQSRDSSWVCDSGRHW